MLWTLLSVASRTAAAKAQLRTLTPTPTLTLTANLNPTQAQLRVVTMNIHAWSDSEHRLIQHGQSAVWPVPQEEAVPLGAQPVPQVLERAASKAAGFHRL